MTDLDSLWDFNDIPASEAAFQRRLEIPLPPDDEAEVLTQIARTMSLRGRFDEAHELLDKAAGMMSPSSKAEVRYMLERGRTINSAGGRVACRQVFHQAVDAAKILGDPHLIVDAMHMVGIVEDGEEGLNWTMRALEYADASTDAKAQNWRASLLNNAGWALMDSGKAEEALPLFQKAQRLRLEAGETQREQVARWCLARCLRELSKTAEALEIQLRLEEEKGDFDGYVLEELALLYADQNNPKSAGDYARRALAVLGDGFKQSDPERWERLNSLS